jgi:hypothetical protein
VEERGRGEPHQWWLLEAAVHAARRLDVEQRRDDDDGAVLVERTRIAQRRVQHVRIVMRDAAMSARDSDSKYGLSRCDANSAVLVC